MPFTIRLQSPLILLLTPLVAFGAEQPDVAAKADMLTAARERPSMFVTGSPREGLRSVADVRRGIESGHAKDLWDALLAKVDRELAEPVITPMQEKDGALVLGNRPYWLVAQTANRILDAAFAGLVLEDRRYVDGALQQIMALFDETQWPEWSDQAHLNVGLNADLRHGQLVVPVALAYDWLYDQLTPEEREAIIDGLDRCAITPYKAGYAAEEHWSRRRSNWMTVVLGGFGIAGMALGPDHPDSALLVANSLPRMESYLDIVGPEGEFNESVQYAGSMAYVVRYFMAMRYASSGVDNPFERHSFSKFYEWYMLMTFPPGRVAGFGDPAPDMPPVVVPVAAVAAATQDPLLQWFYEQYNGKMAEATRQRALEVLYYDANLAPQSPQSKKTLGKAFHRQGHLVSSRSSWDPVSTTSVVYGKAGREGFHGHADWGQVCIDGYGERLVVDLGSPPGYPKGNYEYYYNYQQFGHNVFVFGENDTGGVSLRERGRNGAFIWTEFDENRGAAWSIDLSGVYDGGVQVTRTVVHLLPRVAAVLDIAALPTEQSISMRWHLAEDAEPAEDGSFSARSGKATLVGRTLRLDGEADLTAGKHTYKPPYNTHRLGAELKQKHEPYIELKATDNRCKVLTLFAVYGPGDEAMAWTDSGNGWSIATPEGEVTVTCTQDTLVVRGPGGKAWDVPVDGD
jgi:Heparinase II/III-like protein